MHDLAYVKGEEKRVRIARNENVYSALVTTTAVKVTTQLLLKHMDPGYDEEAMF